MSTIKDNVVEQEEDMLSFSERNGFKAKFQINEISLTLTNLLWDIFDRYLGHRGYKQDSELYKKISERRVNHFVTMMHDRCGQPNLNTMRTKNDMLKEEACKTIFSNLIWHQKYDFIEYFLQNSLMEEEEKKDLIALANKRLRDENSAYRIMPVYNIITPIIAEEEVKVIEQALSLPMLYENIKKQLVNSIQQISNKQNPDYRASVKESISSIETLFRQLFSKDKKGKNDLDGKDLAYILQQRDRFPYFHASFLSGVDKLYGFSSDIARHGYKSTDKEEFNAELSDAIFMLVFCSSLVTYIITKYNDRSLEGSMEIENEK